MTPNLFGHADRTGESPYLTTGALCSSCRLYRYALWRTWGRGEGAVAFVGLNPSTADETMDDPTIRRCIGFAKSWGFAGICMLNIYAFRATDPRDMKATADPVGPQNDEMLAYYATYCRRIVACWGVRAADARVRQVLSDGVLGSRNVECLGRTKSGAPKHPLYLRADTPLEGFARPRPCSARRARGC